VGFEGKVCDAPVRRSIVDNLGGKHNRESRARAGFSNGLLTVVALLPSVQLEGAWQAPRSTPKHFGCKALSKGRNNAAYH